MMRHNDEFEFLGGMLILMIIALWITLSILSLWLPLTFDVGRLAADLLRPAVSVWQVRDNNGLAIPSAATADGKVIGHRVGSFISYRFDTPQGSYISEQAVSDTDANRVEDNASVNILYDPTNPSISRLADIYLTSVIPEAEGCTGIWIWGGSLLALLFGLVAANRLLDDDHLNRFALTARSKLVPAVMTKSEYSEWYCAAYHFQHEGKRFEKKFAVHRDFYERLAAGQTANVTIEYLATNPNLSRIADESPRSYGFMIVFIVWMLLPTLLILEAVALAGLFGLLVIGFVAVSGLVWFATRRRVMRFGQERHLQTIRTHAQIRTGD